MKRTLAILLALVMVLGLIACGTQTQQPAQQGGEQPAGTSELAGTYNITVWAAEKVVDLTK